MNLPWPAWPCPRCDATTVMMAAGSRSRVRSGSSGGVGVSVTVFSVSEQDTRSSKLCKPGGKEGRGYSSARHISCACLPWRAS
jgi:hypothetical protein